MTAEVEPVESKVRSVTGREKAPEPSRLEAVRNDLEAALQTAERGVKTAVGRARETVGEFRGRRA